MLKIRLARTGRKKLAQYRVVVSDSRQTPKGKFVAQLGHYNPYTKELTLDAEKTQGYIDNGTQMSSRVVKLLQNEKGIKLPDWALKNLITKPEKPKEESAEEESQEEAAEAEEASDDAEETDKAKEESSSDDKDADKAEEESADGGEEEEKEEKEEKAE